MYVVNKESKKKSNSNKQEEGSMMAYIIYTDGSAKGNGSINATGGFGVIVTEICGNENKDCAPVVEAYQEFCEGTTNNREEMKAILWALEHYGDEPHRGNGFLIPIVYSDSSYCVNSFTNWIKGWKANGWKRAGGKKLENLDLIQRYDQLINEGYAIELRKIPGHAGEIYNEVADGLATGSLTVEDVLKEYGC